MVQLEYSVEEPLNREPDLEELVSSFITKQGQGYDRNHGPIPHLDASTHSISISGLVKDDLTLRVQDLEKTFAHSTIVCALQCAGNRRHTMRTKLKEVSGIDWFDGAVMNCKWRGPRLCEILTHAGIASEKEEWDDMHVAFACYQTPTQQDDWYGASIPLTRAMDPEAGVLLALSMNDVALPSNHGGPVRVVVPGIAGARSVKWLDRITVQKTESDNYYQKHDYKILPPEVTSAEEAENWWDKVPALQDMPVNSVIALPRPDTEITLPPSGTIEIKGYALPSGDGGPISKVEVSGDEGKTWVVAEHVGEDNLANHESKWAWCLWKALVSVDKGKDVRIVSRATDNSGNVQVAYPEWNLRGVAYNGYGEVTGLKIV